MVRGYLSTVDRNIMFDKPREISRGDLPSVVRVNQVLIGEDVVSSDFEENSLSYFQQRALDQFRGGEKRVFTRFGAVYRLRKTRARKDSERMLVYV